METYIPQPTQESLSCKTLRSPDSQQLKSIVNNRAETVQQKRLLDTINTAQQVIQCTDGELCDEVRENKPIAPDKNFTAKHVRTPINNTDAIRTHAYREEPSKINTLIDDNTLDLKNIVFESNLPSTPDSTPYHDSELVKTTCNIQETELKKVETIASGYFDLVKPKPIKPRRVENSRWDELETKGFVITNIETFNINTIAPELITTYKEVKSLKKGKKGKEDRKQQRDKIKQKIQAKIEEYLNQRAIVEQETQSTQYIADQQTWADKVKEKFSRIGNQNLNDTSYKNPDEINNIPIIGSKEILIGIGKNEDENIFAFHYDGHK